MEKVIPSNLTAEEHYKVLDEALTNVLRAGGARASDALIDQLLVYDRCLRVALGLPVEVAS